jgi:hypothetical protein
MLTALLVIVAAGVYAWLASRFIWWATRWSAVWAMVVGSLFVLAAFVGAAVIAWLLTRAAFGR